MDQDKYRFISATVSDKMKVLQKDTAAIWGVMNAQEMTEHLADFFNVSTEKIKTKFYTPEEHLPKYMEFLMSEKEFKENTKAPADLLGEKPLPLRFKSLEEAKQNLQQSIVDFVAHFDNEEMKRTLHPVFGMLNYDEWIRLHYKHAVHHLKQFKLI